MTGNATTFDYLTKLNEAQRQAVLFGVGVQTNAGKPLLVIAGAGSGKTNTLAHRVAHLIFEGADPNKILLLTFSRRAASEMIRRVGRILDSRAGHHQPARFAPMSWAGTFHSVGAKLLREYAGRIGLDAAFSIHDREDSGDLLNLVRHELGFSGKDKRFPLKGTCLSIYSAVVNTQTPLAEVLQSTFPWCSQWEQDLQRLFLSYVEAKQAQQVLDYDDLLLYWQQMVADPLLAADIGRRFSHVMVDEYQDTNRLQAAILLALKPDGAGLTVVGDDAQSIYAFRGATVSNILEFPAHFDPPAQIITLDKNYRSTTPILTAANAVIALAKERFSKDLWSDRGGAQKPRLVDVSDDAAQAGYVVEQVLARREEGIPLKQQAILFRTGHHSARVEIELTRRNIPFIKFGGLKFLEAAHIKDILSVMRWGRNLRDRVAGFRALQILPGFGPKTTARILDNLASAPPACALLAEQPVPDGRRAEWERFVPMIETIGLANPAWPAAFDTACAWYETQIERRFADAALRLADLEQLGRIAATYPSLERFLTKLTLDPPEATSAESGVPLLDEDYLILSTIHSAKGQEWTSVTLLNAVDGCLPSDLATGTDNEIEEERRLLYVAMTRARDSLEIIVPQKFYVSQQRDYGDRHVYAARTRFIPRELLHHFEHAAWPVIADIAPANVKSVQPAIDLAARMRSMWR